MIIDCHCHAGQGEGLLDHWSTAAPLDAYLRRARAAGIDCTIVFAAHHTDYAKANAGVARIVAQHGHRLIGFACVHAVRDAGRIEALVQRAVAQWHFRGIKVHAHEAPASREVAAAAHRFRLPVLYDVIGRTYLIEMIAAQCPDVNFIIPHLGSFADDWRAHRQVIDQICRLPNVYADHKCKLKQRRCHSEAAFCRRICAAKAGILRILPLRMTISILKFTLMLR